MRDLYYLGGDVPVSEYVRAVVYFRDNAVLTALAIPDNATLVSEEVDGMWFEAEPIPDYPPSWPQPDRVKRHYLPSGGVIMIADLLPGTITPASFAIKYHRLIDAMSYVGPYRFLLQHHAHDASIRALLLMHEVEITEYSVTQVEVLSLVSA
jgi:hypothetical protein